MALLSSASTAFLATLALTNQACAGGRLSLPQALAAAARLAQQSGLAQAQSANARAQLGVQNLQAALARYNQAQSLAQSLGAPTPAIASGNGLGTGLLLPLNTTSPSSWYGVSATITSGADPLRKGVTDITIKQTLPVARLTWTSFNISAKTKLIFNQSAGGTGASTWVIINSIDDPGVNPSVILGDITAPGKVFIVNPGGAVFGGGASVNVGALAVSTAAIAQSQFGTNSAGNLTYSLYSSQNSANAYLASFAGGSASAPITVMPGASITTNAPSSTGTLGGYVMLLGGEVTNDGVIATPEGQTVLAAGQSFEIRQGYSSTQNPLSTTLGSEVAASGATYVKQSQGTAVNGGIVVADQGDITLVGHDILQMGALLATTTVDTRGSIHLLTGTQDKTASITLATGSVTEVLPEENGATAYESQRSGDIASAGSLNLQRQSRSAYLNDTDNLPDQPGSSRIEISTGGTVTFLDQALALAPGGFVALGATRAITLESGATIDVAGTTSAVLPASADDLVVNVQNTQLRDDAINHGDGLIDSNLNIDLRTLIGIASGAYAGNVYTQGGLLEVSGYLGLVPRTITQWSAVGGQVVLQASDPGYGASTVPNPGTVTLAQGSVINLQGGSIAYQAGPLAQSYIVASDGEVFNVNTAPGNLVYTSLYDGFQVAHARWGVTDRYTNPLLTPSVLAYQGYTQGLPAGTLTVSADRVTLHGDVYGGVTTGIYQTSAPLAGITDALQQPQTAVPSRGTLQIGLFEYGLVTGAMPSSLVFTAPNASASATTGSVSQIDAARLSADGLGDISALSNDTVTVNAPLQVAPGGTIALYGQTVVDKAALTAPGGNITLSDLGQFYQLTGDTAGSVLSIVLGGKGNGNAKPVDQAIQVAAGITLSAAGLWVNPLLDPGSLSDQPYISGGSIALDSAGGFALPQGVLLDVAGGGIASLASKTALSSGGNVTISGDLSPVSGSAKGATDFGATVIGYGESGGGTLSITVPALLLGGGTPRSGTLGLPDSLLAAGFSSYVLEGFEGVTVAPGSLIDPVMPVLEKMPDAPLLPAGSDPFSAQTLYLPPLYRAAANGLSIVQRGGADLTLLAPGDGTGSEASVLGSIVEAAGAGSIDIGAGARIAVDPGSSIGVTAYSQITVLGTLSAHGGSIALASLRDDAQSVYGSSVSYGTDTLAFVPGQSVWLATGSELDVSGQPILVETADGRSIGEAQSGGTIVLGAASGLNVAGIVDADAQVIIRPGAMIDANGAAAFTADSAPGEALSFLSLAQAITGSAPPPVMLYGNGGTIAARSNTGIALDGTLTASGGAADAAGGLLFLRLDQMDLNPYQDIPYALTQPKQIVISEHSQTLLPGNLQPGQAAADKAAGLVYLSQDQIKAGGFSSLYVFAPDISFSGNVDLRVAGSIVLDTGVIGAGPSAYAGAGLKAAPLDQVYAPYIGLFGFASTGPDSDNTLSESDSVNGPIAPDLPSGGTITFNADLLDVQNQIDFGGGREVLRPNTGVGADPTILKNGQTITVTSTLATQAPGFATVELNSEGAVRWLYNDGGQPQTLTAFGNLILSAEQISPASFANGTFASLSPQIGKASRPAGTITIERQGAAAPTVFSIGGSLTFLANETIQDGVVLAPLGTLTFEPTVNTNPNLPAGAFARVVFGPGSDTAVSLDGDIIPYGGTSDGASYQYAGKTATGFLPTIDVMAQSVTIESGAILDLRGGGTLSGAGFVPGRIGTADVLTSPLLPDLTGQLSVNAAGTPADSRDQVFAILPGYQGGYAPAASPGDSFTSASGTAVNYSAPAVGEQIVVGNGVPGLPAGTYTLLPAYYALLPGAGAFRVELAPGMTPMVGATQLADDTVAAPVYTSIANTGIRSDLPVTALFTSAANLGKLSQYDTEGFSTFEAAQAAVFGQPRPTLPQDGGTLALSFALASSALVPGSAFSAAPGTVLEAPAPGGYGATVDIQTNGDGSAGNQPNLTLIGAAPTDSLPGSVNIAAGALDSLSAPRLIIGGSLGTATVASLLVSADATLMAGDIILTAENTLSLLSNGREAPTLSTIGEPSTAYDTPGSGNYFTATSPTIDLSNGDDVYTPTTIGAGAISIGAGSRLLAGDSINIAAAPGSTINIGTGSVFSSKIASITLSYLNLLPGNGGGPVPVLPVGLSVSAPTFAGFFSGSTGTLQITALDAVNLIGSAQLDLGNTSLILNTPAIYGYGAAGDRAAIVTAGTLTWSGVPATSSNDSSLTVSALPGGQIANSAANVSGGLTLGAGEILLGIGPFAEASSAYELDRLAAGFATVTLAAPAITANTDTTLAAYAVVPVAGKAGTGGDLDLVTPLLTTQGGAILRLSAGGAISQAAGTQAAGSTSASLTGQGGEIDMSATSVSLGGTIALPGGQLNATAQAGIALLPGAELTLAGRAQALFDQTINSPGGTLSLATSSGNITEASGASIEVGAPGAAAGSMTLSALSGTVAVLGTLNGTGGDGTAAGSATVLAGTLAAVDGVSGFDALNAVLDAGGFTASRTIEVAEGDIVVDRAVQAHEVSLAADTGAIEVLGTIDAAGTFPGTIALSAGTSLVLGPHAVLDAHATQTATDGYGQPIAAENRAEISLSANGSVTLDAGASIDMSYAGLAGGDPVLGVLTIAAPRLAGGGVAVRSPAGLSVKGAAQINLDATCTYGPADCLSPGSVQDASGNLTVISGTAAGDGTIGLATIADDDAAYMLAVDRNGAALAAQLAGLVAAARADGGTFNLRPGVILEAGSPGAPGLGTLTVAGDLDLSGLRYSDPVRYFGVGTTGAAGSGEAGAISFRAGGKLVVNGSITDGFLAPPDSLPGQTLKSDRTDWTVYAGAENPLGEDVTLPATAFALNKGLELAAGTVFSTVRPIALNYSIVIASTEFDRVQISALTRIPFAFVSAAGLKIPQGGWLTTAPITQNDGTVIPAGTLLAAGDIIKIGASFGPGTVLPVAVELRNNTLVPAGTSLLMFNSQTSNSITLSQATTTTLLGTTESGFAAGAIIPADCTPVFELADGKEPASISLRGTSTADGGTGSTQGYLYPLAQLMPAGDQSWDINLVAGANLGGASPLAVEPAAQLAATGAADPAGNVGFAAGSLILSDPHYAQLEPYGNVGAEAAFSVIRTGTGNLTLLAGGDIDQTSAYGLYTSGTQTANIGAAFESARYPEGHKGALLDGGSADVATVNAILAATYTAYYPDGGGNVLIGAAGNLTGYTVEWNTNGTPVLSSEIGNWLWRQGTTTVPGGTNTPQPAAWWINFGSFVNPVPQSPYSTNPPQLVGFEGVGALGGGNVTVLAGQDAGVVEVPGQNSGAPSSGALDIAVASTGRVVSQTAVPALTGGGSLTVRVGGMINSVDVAAYLSTANNDENGVVTDLRGDISIDAGAIGRLYPVFGTPLANDPRPASPFAVTNYVTGFSTNTTSQGDGLIVAPGDGDVSVTAQRDLVIDDVVDPGRVDELSYTDLTPAQRGGAFSSGGFSAFSLWQQADSVSLFSSGGSVMPLSANTLAVGQTYDQNDLATDDRYVYPANLFVSAASGDIVMPKYLQNGAVINATLETEPAPTGEVSFLAANAVLGNSMSVDLSGANPATLSTPYNPAFDGNPALVGTTRFSNVTSPLFGGAEYGYFGTNEAQQLFAFSADTPTTILHAQDPVPARFYAGSDIIDFQTGEALSYDTGGVPQYTIYLAAKPVWIEAGSDIVSSGSRPEAYLDQTVSQTQPNQAYWASGVTSAIDFYTSGNLVYNVGPDPISLVSAGRDILSSYFYAGGGGLMEVAAGRNINQGNASGLQFGIIRSIGSLLQGTLPSLTGGADIAVLAGTGSGPYYSAFANLYLNPANQADLSLPVTAAANAGKVQDVYANSLLTFLIQNTPYTSADGDALRYFETLPAPLQHEFLLGVFFDELLASGQQYTDASSLFYRSYLRGQQAIDTLFPSLTAGGGLGVPAGYTGSITYVTGTAAYLLPPPQGVSTAFDGGIATLFGGNITVVDPGGSVELGAPGGIAPTADSGIVTFGSGNIDMFALGSVLLGKSRIFTTAGGNIQIWSADGDINAGLGAKTSVVTSPVEFTYDDIGDIVESPTVSSTGAGIATLDPFPNIPAGDLDLTAPLGTIDAGEAGIRVAGNLNLAALQIVGAANITIGGHAAGLPTVSVPSLSAVTAASSAAASSSAAIGDTARGGPQTASVLPSVIDVEVLVETSSGDDDETQRKKKRQF